jgi:hypothetical protein
MVEAIPIAAREISPNGETRKVSIINIDCIKSAFKAKGHARERFFFTYDVEDIVNLCWMFKKKASLTKPFNQDIELTE